jgi:hypothetical protein
MNEALFIDPTIRMEKVAYDIRIDDDPEEWPVSVIRESHKQLPFLKDYETEVEFDKVDTARGYAVGKMLVWPPRMQKQAAAQSKQLVVVPVIIRDREMAPLDVYSHSGSMLPMDQDKVAQVLFQPQMFEGPVPRGSMLGTNLYGNLIPPNTDHQYNAGTLHKHGSAKNAPNYRKAEDLAESCATCKFWQPRGEGKGYCKAYDFICKGSWTCDAWAGQEGTKEASAFWEQAVLTFRSSDINALGEKLAADQGLKHAYTSTPVLRAALADMLRAAESEKTASEVREHRYSSLKPTVVQLTKQGKGYLCKVANHNCFAPRTHKATRFEVQDMLSKEAFDRLLERGQATFTVDPVVTESVVEKTASEVTHFGVYQTWRSGQPLEGMVIPKVVDFDGRDLGMQLFVGEDTHSMQEKVAGVFLSDKDIASDHPRGLGVFVFQQSDHAIATEPVDVQGIVKVSHENGTTAEIVATRMSTGTPLKLTVVPGLYKIASVGNNIALPASARFVSLQGKQSQVASSVEDANLFEQRKVASINTVTLRSDGHTFSLDGHNAKAFPEQDMLADEAEFALCALGLTGTQASNVMKTAAVHGTAKIPFTRLVVPEAVAMRGAVEKVAHAVSLQPEKLRVDLTRELALLTSPKAEELWKEASVTLGKESVDGILSLGFVNPENASLYVAYLPELEKVSSKLAELLVASRLGLDGVRETAAKNAMTQVNAVIRGLEGMRERIS